MNRLFAFAFYFTIFCLCTFPSRLFAQWVQVDSGMTVSSVRSFAVIPNGAGGTNLFAGTGDNSGGVYLSANNGTSWTPVDSGFANSAVISFAVGPNGAGGINLFAGTYTAGAFFSTNNGTSWTPVDSGLPGTYIISLALSPNGNLFAADADGEDGVYLSTNNGTSWTPADSGLTSFVVYRVTVSPNGAGGTNLFAGTNGGVFQSTNNGTNWTATSLTDNNILCFLTVPNGAGVTNLFAGSYNGVHLSTNYGTSWTSVDSGLTNTTVSALAVSPNGTGGMNLFAGTNAGVFLSTNNGTSWTSVGLADYTVYSLVVSGTDLFAGIESDGAWRRPLAEMSLSLNQDLVAYYPFNGNANDESGNGNNGTVYGATLTTDRFGNPNSAYEFNGSSDYIEINSADLINFPIGNSARTITAWFEKDSSTSWNAIFYYGNDVWGGIGGSFSFGIWGDSLVVDNYFDNGGLYCPTSTDCWHFITCVYSGGEEIEFFIDNAYKGSITLPETLNTSQTGHIGIGRRWDADGNFQNPFQGSIDDIRIYNRALSDTEIQALFHEGGWPRVDTSLGVKINPRWNIISVPLYVGNYQKDTLFPSATTPAYAYQGGYVPKDTLANGVGYWLKFNSAQRFTITGYYSATSDTIQVTTGWNLIGSIYTPVPADSIISIPGALVTSQLFAYNGGYTVADTIRPGEGYWIKSTQAGELILSSTSTGSTTLAKRSNHIRRTLTGTPPPPPDGKETAIAIPKTYGLSQNYPNPFNPTTSINYALPQSAHVKLEVFNTLGEQVALLVNEQQQAGYHTAVLQGNALASGVYFYRISAGSFMDVKKLILMK
jgi:hypothetical protein